MFLNSSNKHFFVTRLLQFPITQKNQPFTVDLSMFSSGATISTLKKKNKITRELLSKIEWACSLNAIKLEHEMIFEGCLRIIEHTNLAYVEPHRVIIKDKLFLFFNECDYFYVGDLRYKYPLSQLKDYIERLL